MKLSTLFEQLNFPYIIEKHIKNDTNITEMSLICPQIDENKENIFYIGNPKELPFTPLNILTTNKEFVNDAQNYIIVEEDDFHNAINHVFSIFMQRSIHQEEIKKLCSNVNTMDLHLFLNRAATLLDRSLVVTDLGFQVIDYSTSVPITDPIWKKNISRGTVSTEFIKEINKLIPENVDVSTPFFVNCSYSTENKLCSYINYHNSNIGYLILIDNNKGVRLDVIDYLKELSNAIIDPLERSKSFSTIFNQVQSDLFRDILDKNENREEALQQLQNLKTFPKNMIMICIKTHQNSKHDMTYIKNSIRTIFKEAYAFLYKGFVVAIVDSEEFESVKQQPFDELKVLIDKLIISEEFSNIKKISTFFGHDKETLRLLQNSQSDKIIYYTSDFRIYSMLDHIENVDRYIHPAIERLTSEEQFNTLKTYVENDCNILECAEKLFIHRNTFTYRINKIVELTGLNLENPNVIFNLALSFKIIEYINTYSK